jgi:hypothetical protein
MGEVTQLAGVATLLAMQAAPVAVVQPGTLVVVARGWEKLVVMAWAMVVGMRAAGLSAPPGSDQWVKERGRGRGR